MKNQLLILALSLIFFGHAGAQEAKSLSPLVSWFSDKYTVDFSGNGQGAAGGPVSYPLDLSGKTGVFSGTDLKVNLDQWNINHSFDAAFQYGYFIFGNFKKGQIFEFPLVFGDQHYVSNEWIISVQLNSDADAQFVAQAIKNATQAKGITSTLKAATLDVVKGPFTPEGELSSLPNHIPHILTSEMGPDNQFHPVGGWAKRKGIYIEFLALDSRPPVSASLSASARSRINLNAKAIEINITVDKK